MNRIPKVAIFDHENELISLPYQDERITYHWIIAFPFINIA